MDVQGGGYAVRRKIQRLPEECLSHAILRTSPRDACRSEAVSAAFRSAAASDNVWKSFVPSDYAEILARAVDRVEFASMKDLYFLLCDPILIDGGKMGFFVDRETGVKCFILPGTELCFRWGDTPYWNHHPESRFPEGSGLFDVSCLEIRGRINSRLLYKRSNYSAYLVFKFSSSAVGLEDLLQKGFAIIGSHVSQLSICRPRSIIHRPRYLRNFFRRANFPQEPPEDLLEAVNGLRAEQRDDMPEEADKARHDQRQYPDVEGHDESERNGEIVGKPQLRQDGWMEIFLEEFYNEEGDDGEVVMSFFGMLGGDLIVQGIEIRPKKGVCMLSGFLQLFLNGYKSTVFAMGGEGF